MRLRAVHRPDLSRCPPECLPVQSRGAVWLQPLRWGLVRCSWAGWRDLRPIVAMQLGSLCERRVRKCWRPWRIRKVYPHGANSADHHAAADALSREGFALYEGDPLRLYALRPARHLPGPSAQRAARGHRL